MRARGEKSVSYKKSEKTQVVVESWSGNTVHSFYGNLTYRGEGNDRADTTEKSEQKNRA